MSWQSYVDQSLMGAGTLSQAAIVGYNGAVWAQTAGFPAAAAYIVQTYDDAGNEIQKSVSDAQECAKIAAGVNGSMPHSIYLGGVKYLGNLREYGQEDCKAFFHGKKGATSGVAIAVTTQAIVIGVWNKAKNPAQECVPACNTVRALAKYLLGNGY